MASAGMILSRRVALAMITAVIVAGDLPASAEARPRIVVHKDPKCGCCTSWVKFLEQARFPAVVMETSALDAVKRRLGVPDEFASCHTAEIEGYVLEGHVPVAAILRLLAEKPKATGLAVPGMPIGSPGMEVGPPENYEVVLFGPEGRSSYGRFRGERAL